MKFVTHESIEKERAQAHALRRYVAARAAGRTHPEYAKIEIRDGIAVWHSCTETDAKLSGGASRRLRQPGPWCPYLGRDTSIQSDHDLMAYLELRVSDDETEREHDWNKLLKEVAQNRVKALRAWRVKGQEILVRQRQRQAAPVAVAVSAKTLVSEKYLKRGAGIRPLKTTKTAK